MEFDQRKALFLEKYKDLIDTLKVDFIARPVFVPNEKGTWELIVTNELMDMNEAPVKSPVQL